MSALVKTTSIMPTLGDFSYALSSAVDSACAFVIQRVMWWWHNWDDDYDPLMITLRRYRRERKLIRESEIFRDEDGCLSVCL